MSIIKFHVECKGQWGSIIELLVNLVASHNCDSKCQKHAAHYLHVSNSIFTFLQNTFTVYSTSMHAFITIDKLLESTASVIHSDYIMHTSCLFQC